MPQNSPMQIFSSSAKKEKSKDPLPSPKSSPAQNAQIEEMLRRMNDMRKEIDRKVEETALQNGLTKEQIWQFLDNPKNFTPDEWQLIQNERKTFSQRVDQVLVNLQKPNTNPTLTDSERKAKFVGTRRHWIPTR